MFIVRIIVPASKLVITFAAAFLALVLVFVSLDVVLPNSLDIEVSSTTTSPHHSPTRPSSPTPTVENGTDEQRNLGKRQITQVGRQSGCGNESLRQIMEHVLIPLLERNSMPLGDIAQIMRDAAQAATKRSHEVLLGKGDMAIASHQLNETAHCRLMIRDITATVYETPVLYDVSNVEQEQRLSNIDFGEPLGGSGSTGQKRRTRVVKTPKRPVGHARLRGGINEQLVQISRRVLKPLLERQEMKLGDIAKELQKSVQTATGKSHEILMGKGDMMIASHLRSTSFSRMRFGDYYTLIYETPVPYDIANAAEEQFLSNVDFGESLGGSGSPGQAPLQHLGHARLRGEGNVQLRQILQRDLSQLLPRNQATMTIGDIAKSLQQSLHSATGNSHEVFIGKGDMMIASHQMSLSYFARARFGEYYTLVYRTPVEYDIANAAEEQFFSNIDSGQVATQQLTTNNFVESWEFVQFPAEAPFPLQAPPADFSGAFTGLNGLNGLNGQRMGGQGGGGGAGACFSGDMIIETIDGPKRMRDLRTGDNVLSIDKNMLVFTPVIMFLHREEDLLAEFNLITTADGKTIQLTDEHLIYVSDCSRSSALRLVRADQVTPDHCVMTVQSHSVRGVRVVSVTKTYERGIYAPLTSTGDIIVNDILSSCHVTVAVRTLQQAYLTLYRSLVFFLQEEGELPIGLAYIMRSLELFIPIKIEI